MKAHDVQFIGVHFATCSRDKRGKYAALDLIAPVARIEVIGGSVNQSGDRLNAAVGVRIGKGVDYVRIIGLDTSYALERGVENESNGTHVMIMVAGQRRLSAVEEGKANDLAVVNRAQGERTQSRLSLATGSANAYAINAVQDGGQSRFAIATGKGLANGIQIAPGTGPFSVFGYQNYGGPSPSASACGEGWRVEGNDDVGRVKVGAGSRGCMVRFAVPWTSRPVCSIVNETKGVPLVPGEVTRGRMTLSRGFAFLATLAYRCVGYQ